MGRGLPVCGHLRRLRSRLGSAREGAPSNVQLQCRRLEGAWWRGSGWPPASIQGSTLSFGFPSVHKGLAAVSNPCLRGVLAMHAVAGAGTLPLTTQLTGQAQGSSGLGTGRGPLGAVGAGLQGHLPATPLQPLTWPPAATWFEHVSMLVIMLNCVTLGMFRPCEDVECRSERCSILEVGHRRAVRAPLVTSDP